VIAVAGRVENSSAPFPELRVESIADGLAYPWSIAFLPGSEDALVTERPGRMRRLHERALSAPLAGLPQVANLFDVAVAADFGGSRGVYFSLVRELGGELALEVWRAELRGHALVDARSVYRATARSISPTVLNSGRLLVTGQGEVIVSVADFDDHHSSAQDASVHWGKLVRIRDGVAPEVIASGVRNAQGVARDASGAVWFTDHGPLGGDELNALYAGANYGWPRTSGGRHYDGTALPARAPQGLAFSAPIVTWTPAIAPSSLLVYSGREFPEWRGSFLVGSLARRHLRRLELRGGVMHSEEIHLDGLGERIRDVRSDDAGRLYVLTDALHGRLLRITRARPVTLSGCSRCTSTKATSVAAACPEGKDAAAGHRRADVHRLDAAARDCAVHFGDRRRLSRAQCSLVRTAR
jgi:aldose sugar dehydrogenase